MVLAEHLVLVGLMGSGKSTVGVLLAKRLGRPLVDSDAQVEARAGRTVREIWRDEGEDAFRKLEAEALADAVAAPEPCLIAAAGGTVLAAANRAVLAQAGTVVWLRGTPDVLVTRADQGEHRPLLDDDPAATLRRMQTERDALYRSVADHVVDVDHRTPAEVADEIMELVT